MNYQALNIFYYLKNEVFDYLNTRTLTNRELYSIFEEWIDFEDFDIPLTDEDIKTYLENDIESFIRNKENTRRLEILLEYIYTQDYNLESFFSSIHYDIKRHNIFNLDEDTSSYLADELEICIYEVEYKLETSSLEKTLVKWKKISERNSKSDDSIPNIELEKALQEIKKLEKELSDLKIAHDKMSKQDKISSIQAKKNITVKELSKIYNISSSSQRDYRSRLNDPLPYHQKVAGGKIVYVAEEVEKWFQNQHK